MIYRGIDIFDINYELSSEEFGLLHLSKNNLPRKGILTRILILLYHAAAKVSKSSSGLTKTIGTDPTLLFGLSKNELDVLHAIAPHIDNSYVIGDDTYNNGFPLRRIYLRSLLYIPVVLWHFITCRKPFYRKSFAYAFDYYCLSYATIYHVEKYLGTVRPANLVIANHAAFFHRIFNVLSARQGVRNIYIQHASLISNFPSLGNYEIALLEGEDSLQKLQNGRNRDLKVYLVGMAKLDVFIKNKKKEDVNKSKRIGICTNGLDSMELYQPLITRLKKEFADFEIIVRPHPADIRKEKWIELTKDNQVLFSDFGTTISFDFLGELDILIAGESNIHLEAACLNVPSVYFDTEGQCRDWYGFYKNGLVQYAGDVDQLITCVRDCIDHPKNVKKIAKFYIDSLKTPFEGRTSELAGMIISCEEEANHNFERTTDVYNNSILKLKSYAN
jgi:hypothetical protein